MKVRNILISLTEALGETDPVFLYRPLYGRKQLPVYKGLDVQEDSNNEHRRGY